MEIHESKFFKKFCLTLAEIVLLEGYVWYCRIVCVELLEKPPVNPADIEYSKLHFINEEKGYMRRRVFTESSFIDETVLFNCYVGMIYNELTCIINKIRSIYELSYYPNCIVEIKRT